MLRISIGKRQILQWGLWLAFASVPCGAQALSADQPYAIVQRIPAAALYWDYGSIDLDRGRLYVGRIGGVLSLDLATSQVTEKLFGGTLVHGAIAIEGRHLVVASDGGASELIVYDSQAGKVLSRVKVGGHPDSVAYDRDSNTVVTVNKETQDLTFVDAATWTVKGTVPLGGDPEFAASDGHGTLYVNIADKAQVVAVTIATRQIIRREALRGCKEPSGMAFDVQNKLVISVCGNGIAKFVLADTFKEVASIKVGRGADAVILDARRHLAFIPSGNDGTLSIIAIRSSSDIAQIAVVTTEKGARSGAVDPNSGRIYLPAGRMVREEHEQTGGWHPPAVMQESFKILVVAPVQR
jgi:DNA-binding beta-propeller fold protein YncE